MINCIVYASLLFSMISIAFASIYLHNELKQLIENQHMTMAMLNDLRWSLTLNEIAEEDKEKKE